MGRINRSLRLEKRSAKSLDTLSGAAGEIFYDADNGTLRVYTDNSGDKIILTSRKWVADNTFGGSYNDLTDRPTAFANLDFIGLALGGTINEFSNDATMVDDSDTAVPTEHAVKTYVDAAIGGTASSISTLTDVTLTNLQQNEVLQYNGNAWVNVNIADAQDTNTTYSIQAVDNPSGGAYIQLNGSDASTDFVELTAGSGITVTRISTSVIEIGAGAGALSLDDLSDVDTTSAAPATGQVLKWDGTKWAPGNDATAGGVGLDADTLDGQDGSYYLDYNNFSNTPSIPADLTDLGISDGSTGQFLKTDGAGNFSFATVTIPSAVNVISDLSDVNTSGATSGQVLKYNGTTWVPGTDNTGTGGSIYDQDLNTTDDVEFASVSAAAFTNTGIGSPDITSASTITLTAPDGVTITDFIVLPALTAAPSGPVTGTVAVADGTTWDPAGTGTETMVVYLGGAWQTIANA